MTTEDLPGETVAAWPRLSAVVRPDGSGSITVNGTERPCVAASLEELRTGVIARATSFAMRLGRPVRLTVVDGPSSWNLGVRPQGIVQLLGEDGTLPAAEGLAPHEGRCRGCRRLNAVHLAVCEQCGLEEPLRVEAEPVDVAPFVPERPAAPIATVPREAESAEPAVVVPDPAPAARPRLSLSFSSQPAVEVDGGVALGRKPEPVGGRTAIQVASPGRMLSRTHVLLDLEADGRIFVTDQHSGNGTRTDSEPPVQLEPGVPLEVPPGTRLVLGDVTVDISLVAPVLHQDGRQA